MALLLNFGKSIQHCSNGLTLSNWSLLLPLTVQRYWFEDGRPLCNCWICAMCNKTRAGEEGDAGGWIPTELGTAEGVRRSGKNAREQAGSGVVYVQL